jgi:hypothetical protein
MKGRHTVGRQKLRYEEILSICLLITALTHFQSRAAGRRRDMMILRSGHERAALSLSPRHGPHTKSVRTSAALSVRAPRGWRGIGAQLTLEGFEVLVDRDIELEQCIGAAYLLGNEPGAL